jgi:hypothetical protein
MNLEACCVRLATLLTDVLITVKVNQEVLDCRGATNAGILLDALARLTQTTP